MWKIYANFIMLSEAKILKIEGNTAKFRSSYSQESNIFDIIVVILHIAYILYLHHALY